MLIGFSSHGLYTQVHAENGDAVAWGQKHVFEDLGITGELDVQPLYNLLYGAFQL